MQGSPPYPPPPYGQPPQPYGQPPQPYPPPPGGGPAPLHMLPVPRPAPPGVGWDRTDLPYVIWMVVAGALSLFCLWYAFFYAHAPDMQMGALVAMVPFTLLAATMTAIWLVRRGRRKRVFVFGRAVPGRLLQTTNVQVTARAPTGGVVRRYSYKVVLIGFEDKQVRLPARLDDPNLAVFVEGPWAGIVLADTGSVEIAKWGPLSPNHRP